MAFKLLKKYYPAAKENKCNVLIPIDVSVGKNLKDSKTIKTLSEIEEDDLILDIGPKTIKLICSLLENSKTVLWNGPIGYFENSNFAIGSIEIAKKIVDLKNKFTQLLGEEILMQY